DGSIYAASGFLGVFLNGQRGVFRYNPANGSFALFAPASDPQSGQTGGLGALARSPSGDLYVARSGMGIERYSGTTGASLGVIIPASPPGIFTGDLGFGPDANLYVPSAQGVDRFNPQTGAALGPFVTGLPG